MPAPVISFRSSTDATQLIQQPLTYGNTTNGGAVKAGTESQTRTFRIYNDYDGTANSSTATDVDITLKTNAGGNGAAGDPVGEKWFFVRELTPVARNYENNGYGGASVYVLSNIEKQAYVEVETKMVVPGNAAAQTYNFLIRVSYSYT